MSRTVPVEGGELRYREPIAPDHAEWLDEIVVRRPRFVHVEVMGDSHIWMGIDLPDGSRLMVNFFSISGRAKIAYRCDVEPPTRSQKVEGS